jgi:hypothetical protein
LFGADDNLAAGLLASLAGVLPDGHARLDGPPARRYPRFARRPSRELRHVTRHLMIGMTALTFGGSTNSEMAQSLSFQHEFAPASMICELSLTMVNENDDESGSEVGFSSFTFEDDDGTPHENPIGYDASRGLIWHNRIRRCDWFLRIYNTHSRGLLNIFIWDSVE